jgi:hypothetical protein
MTSSSSKGCVYRANTLALGLASALAMISAANKASAEIHDYMVLRLIYLGTSCGTQHLTRIEAERDDWRRFHAECRDVNAYPNGLFVTCTDPADDRSCSIETPPQTFDSLELLRPAPD